MKLSVISIVIIKRIALLALIISIIALILSFFVVPITTSAALLFSLCVIIMSLVNCLKIYMLERSLIKGLNLDDPAKHKGYFWLQYIIRYFLTIFVVVAVVAITFFITGESPFITIHTDTTAPRVYNPIIFGLAVGLFTMKFGIMLTKVGNSESDEETSTDTDKFDEN